MWTLAARRLALLLPTLLGVATLTFVVLHFVPGDPVDLLIGESATPADREALRRDLGLDRPLAAQYVQFLGGLVRGELGESLAFRAPVASVIASRYPATIELAAAALVTALILALPLGVLGALRPRSWFDRLARIASLAGVCIPTLCLGPALILLFSLRLDWLPVSGRGGAAHLVLPAVTLGLGMAGVLVRQTRSSVIAALREDYVRTARAKGVPEWRVVWSHALRNALIPVVTVSGMQAGSLLAGAVITETIFAWPGVGRLAVQAIGARDFSLVQGCVLAMGLTYVVINSVTDLLYGVIDPRLRDERR